MTIAEWPQYAIGGLLGEGLRSEFPLEGGLEGPDQR